MASPEMLTAREKGTTIATTTKRAAPTDQMKRGHPLPNGVALGVRATTLPADTIVMDGNMAGSIDTATAPATRTRNPDPHAREVATATPNIAPHAHEAATVSATLNTAPRAHEAATAIRDLYPTHPLRCGRATPPSRASKTVSQ